MSQEQATASEPAELADLSLDEIADRYVARFRDRIPDWEAFPDALLEGNRRAQHRFIGTGGAGKIEDQTVIPPRAFTLSVMHIPPGQGNAEHTHEVEEVFFVLQGYITAIFADRDGNEVTRRLGPWDCAVAPPGVIHGFKNEGLEPAYVQVMLGRSQPDRVGYVDPEIAALYDQ
jgi:mannose-6-phosphate isomerase-like protein (cupin superfamily)